MYQLVHLQEIVGHRALVHLDGDHLVFQVHCKDPSHVAVEDLFVIVVANLHHPVTGAVGPPAHLPLGQARFRRVERLLQPGIERLDPQVAAAHGGEHLDVVVRIEVKLARDALSDDLYHQISGFHRIFLAKEEEVGRIPVVKLRHFPAVDAVGVGDDVAALRLPEDGVEANDSRG